jgi:allantoin racemase
MKNPSPIRIGVIVPITGITETQMEARRQHLLEVCCPQTEVAFYQNEIGPTSIESHYEHDWAAVEVVKTAIQLEKEGVDAIIPWCGGGPGVTAGREVLKIPIVSPFQSSCQIAVGLGYRFGVIIPLSKNIKATRHRIHDMNLQAYLASVSAVDIPVLELKEDPDRLLDTLSEIGRALVDQQGADIIVTTCLGMCGMAKPLMERLPVPVVDPGWAAVTMAETLVRLGLTHSKETYASPKGFGVGE